MKTSELTGAALDWAVAKAEGVAVRWSAPHEQLLIVGKPYSVWHPSTDWSQGGPIVEREKICTVSDNDATGNHSWFAQKSDGFFMRFGPTPLIAAMRCYCASKLGDEVDIPEELK